MNKIGISTVTFRHWFKQTKVIDQPKKTITLFEIPEYFADRYKVHNVELWSRHFDAVSLHYLNDLKSKVSKSHSQIINIQIDEPYNLADSDITKRRNGIDLLKKWIDIAEVLDSKAIRANPGKGNLNTSIQSLIEINHYAQEKGIKLLTENHFGIETDPNNHIKIIKNVGTNNIYALPDFGNYKEDERYRNLEKIMPYAYLVSAKVELFNKKWEHISFDFDKCMNIAIDSGYDGIFSVEQWERTEQSMDFEKVTDWTINSIKNKIYVLNN